MARGNKPQNGELLHAIFLSTLAEANGWAVFHDKKDFWIAAATRVSGATFLNTDLTGFLPLRDGKRLDVIVLDPVTGWRLP